MKLVLASGSPRRRELLAHLGVDFAVVVSGFDEESLEHARAEVLAKRLAAAKTQEVAARHPEAVVLGADTIVVHRGEMLGKPADAAEAQAMLRRLRGRIHRVITGIAVMQPGSGAPRVAATISKVRMRTYTDAEIDDTIGRGVPFDKAGGYGIQDPALRPVEACDGCFCSVMGLPLWPAARLLQAAGIHVRTDAMPGICASCPARSK